MIFWFPVPIASVQNTPYNFSADPSHEESAILDAWNKNWESYLESERKRNASRRGFKRIWTDIEEKALSEAIQKFGKDSWRKISKDPAIHRTRKQLSEKWTNQLSPDLLKGPIRKEHEGLIIRLNCDYPGRWSKIRDVFAKTALLGKPEGKYYSAPTIRKYFSEKQKNLSSESERSSSVITCESQDTDSFDGFGAKVFVFHQEV